MERDGGGGIKGERREVGEEVRERGGEEGWKRWQLRLSSSAGWRTALLLRAIAVALFSKPRYC